jgi:hypothetical protein
MVLSEAVMEEKLIPIGDSPKNKPAKPAKPKLNATERTNSSMGSSLLLPKNKTFTKQ